MSKTQEIPVGNDHLRGIRGRLDRGYATLVRWAKVHRTDLIELGLLALWAVWVGRRFLDMDPSKVPIGSEFGVVTQFHYVWDLLKQCGSCVFWNGMSNGGAPGFVDLHGAVLNPLVVLSTLSLGVINGSKVLLVLSLFLAGLAQWWVGRLLRVGWLARDWSAAMAVVGAHIAGRLQLGLVTMILSIAMASLVFAAWLMFLDRPSRRAGVILGVLFALLLLSGQGYAQYVTILGIFPAGLILLIGRGPAVRLAARHLVPALGIALLLAAPLLVPTIHFWPQMSIHGDPGFSGSQSLEYLPLNLVIRDLSFYSVQVLGRVAAPALFVMYIGWVPILLAIVGSSSSAWGRHRWFLLVPAALAFVLGSSEGPRALAKLVPMLAVMFRYPSLGCCLAITPLLGLSALGVETLVRCENLRLKLTTSSGKSLTMQAWYLVLALPLLFAIRTAYAVSRTYLDVRKVPDLISASLPLVTSFEGEWVATPRSDFLWYPVLQPQGVLLSYTFRPWDWVGRGPVPPRLEATYAQDAIEHPDYLETISGVHWLLHPDNHLAFILASDRTVPCQAKVRGGFIDVACEADSPGFLTVMEYNWSGWKVFRDGEPADLMDSQWLSTEAPAGAHTYAFRYRPWDAPLGLGLCGVGMLFAVWWWGRRPEEPVQEEHSAAS